MANKLLAIDGNNLIHRFYWSTLPEDPQAEPYHALFGALNSILYATSRHKTNRVTIAWDNGQTFRHEMYPKYKANRDDKPDGLMRQLESAPYFFESIGFKCIQARGYEADDILASLAYQHGQDVVVMTADRDLLAVVGSGVEVDLVRRHKGPDEKWHTTHELFETTLDVADYIGVPPHQIKEKKALAGDKSDNIDGIPGIGDKIAIDLIKKYRDLETLYDRLDELVKKDGKPFAYQVNLRDNKDLAFLFRNMFVLRADLEIPIGMDTIPSDSNIMKATRRWSNEGAAVGFN